MNILIPMAGLGERFKNEGYRVPKFNIDIFGKPMIERALESLRIVNAQYIFITLNVERETRTILENFCDAILSSPPIIIDTSSLSAGPACSCLEAQKYINSNEELLIANCDQILSWNFPNFLYYARNPLFDGVIVTYESDTPKNSYAKLKRGRVVEIKEKEVISNVSLNGVHYWKRGRDFVQSALEMIANNDTAPNGEFYVGPTYNYLVDKKYITNYHIAREQHYAVGTPDDLNLFLENFDASL